MTKKHGPRARKMSAEAAAFERSLETVQKSDRPEGYPGLTPKNRRAASRSQFLLFKDLYWHDWRHTKIRLYQQQLEERDSIVERERSRFKRGGSNPEFVVYREVTNGLIAAAASEFCQYAEDLAVLACACKSDESFARDLATSNAGRMQNMVKSWRNIDRRRAASILRIPWCEPDESWVNTQIGRDYLRRLDIAVSRLTEIALAYQEWQFHYMKYKHGLLLALQYEQPGEAGIQQFIENRRASTRGFPVAFDCGDVADAIDGVAAGKSVPGQGIILAFGAESDDVRWNSQPYRRSEISCDMCFLLSAMKSTSRISCGWRRTFRKRS